jgi:hypothetical protein
MYKGNYWCLDTKKEQFAQWVTEWATAISGKKHSTWKGSRCVKMTAFLEMTSCSLVNRYRRFENVCCLYPQVRTDTARFPETSVHYYRNTRQHIPKHDILITSVGVHKLTACTTDELFCFKNVNRNTASRCRSLEWRLRQYTYLTLPHIRLKTRSTYTNLPVQGVSGDKHFDRMKF